MWTGHCNHDIRCLMACLMFMLIDAAAVVQGMPKRAKLRNISDIPCIALRDRWQCKKWIHMLTRSKE